MSAFAASINLRDIDRRRRGTTAAAFTLIWLLILGLLKGKARRWIAEALVYTMLMTLCPPGLQVRAAAVPVSSWTGLSDALSRGGDFVLTEDIIAPEGAEGLRVENNAILNLSGHTIDAAGHITDSAVINVYDTLTVTNDSGLSAPMGGYIKGGLNTQGNGGGIYVAKGAVLNMDGGAVIDCTAKNGGGIYSEGDLHFNGGKVGEPGHGNRAVENGGGIYIDKKEAFTFGNAVIIGNDAGEYGGGMYVDNEEGSIGEDSENFDDSEKNGGSGGPKTDDPEESAAATVSEDSVSPNMVGRNRVLDESLTVRYENISGHTGEREYGGGAQYTFGGQSANIYWYFTNIHGNSAEYGGGIGFGSCDPIPPEGQISKDPDVYKNYGIILTSGWFRASGIYNNTASQYGGGLYFGHNIPNHMTYTENLQCHFYDTKICSNSAQYGGGVCISGETIEWISGEISYNNATKIGGGIYGGQDHKFESGFVIKNNSAGEVGGAFYVDNRVYMYGGSINNNSSTGTVLAAHSAGSIQGYGHIDGNSCSNGYPLELGGAGNFGSIICSSGTLTVKNSNGIKIHSGGSVTTTNEGDLTVDNGIILDDYGAITCSSGSTCEVYGGSGLSTKVGSSITIIGGLLKATNCSNGGFDFKCALSNAYGTIICENCTTDGTSPVLGCRGMTRQNGEKLDIVLRNCSGTGPLMTTIGEIRADSITMENNVVTGNPVTGGIINAQGQNTLEALYLNSIIARGNHIGENTSSCTGGLIYAGNVSAENGYSITDNTIGGSTTATIGGLIYAEGLTLGGSGRITGNSVGGDPTASGQGAPVYVANSNRNFNLSGTPYIAGNTFTDAGGNKKESNVGLGNGCKIIVNGELGSGSQVSVSPPGALPGSEGAAPADYNSWLELNGHSANAFVCDNEHLYFMPGTTKIGYHDHVWSYIADGSAVSARCATHGCRYENITMKLSPPANLIYDGQPKAVVLAGNYPVSDVEGLAEAPEKVEYFGAEERGSTDPKGSALSGPPSDIGNYVARFTWAGKNGLLALFIGTVKVLPIGDEKYASSMDNFAPLSPKGKIKKMQLDFSRVKESFVNPQDLTITAIKGSKFTTVARIAEGGTVQRTGSVKVKVNKKSRIATISCNKTGEGTVTLPMEDGVTYTVTFTVQKPKAQKTTITGGGDPVTKTIKELFNTDIDGGDLTARSKKNKTKATVSADNTLIVEPEGKDTLKLKYKYMNKKYKLNIKVR